LCSEIAAFTALLPADDAAALATPSSPEVPAVDELADASALLGVSPADSREAVTRRHRELTGAASPSGFAAGAGSEARAYARHLDEAHAVIRARRGWR